MEGIRIVRHCLPKVAIAKAEVVIRDSHNHLLYLEKPSGTLVTASALITVMRLQHISITTQWQDVSALLTLGPSGSGLSLALGIAEL